MEVFKASSINLKEEVLEIVLYHVTSWHLLFHIFKQHEVSHLMLAWSNTSTEKMALLIDHQSNNDFKSIKRGLSFLGINKIIAKLTYQKLKLTITYQKLKLTINISPYLCKIIISMSYFNISMSCWLINNYPLVCGIHLFPRQSNYMQWLCRNSLDCDVEIVFVQFHVKPVLI